MRDLYLLMFLSVLNHTVLGGTRVVVALHALALGATAFTVGVLMALYALLPMLFAVSMGRLVDRVGARMPMLAGSILLAASAGLPFAWPNLTMLHISSALIGATFMVYHLPYQHIAGYIGKPEDRAINFSVAALGFSISGFAGPMLAGFGIDLLGHRNTFLVFCFMPLVPAAVLALGKPIFPRTPGHGTPPEPGRRVMDLLRHVDLRRIFLISALFAMAWDLFMFAMPIYGSRVGLSATIIGVVLGSFSLATFTIRLFLPLIVRRLPPWPLLAMSLAAAATMFFLLPFFESAALLMAVGFLLGLGLGVSQPMVMSLLHNTAPAGRMGEAVGVRITLINISQTGMPLIFGALLVLGMKPVFWATALVMGAGGYVAHRHAGRVRKPKP